MARLNAEHAIAGLGRVGLYRTRLDAAVDGEQSLKPVAQARGTE